MNILLALTLIAAGQDRDRDRERRAVWCESVESALGQITPNRRLLFVYVAPASDPGDPTVFRNPDVQAAAETFVPVKIIFDKEHPDLKEYRVASAPAILCCDRYGNEVARGTSLSVDVVRGLIRTAPDAAAKLEAHVRSLGARVEEAERSGERARILKACADVIRTGKRGFPEIAAAAKKLDALAEPEFAKVDLAASVDARTAIEQFERIAKEFAGTPPAVRAEVRIAELENGRGSAAAAVARLQKASVAASPAFEAVAKEARETLDRVVREGIDRVAEAEKLPREQAREALRKLQKEYAGTEAGKSAGQALRRTEPR
jgi:hypothetical protein